jgi:hypothetical protein
MAHALHAEVMMVPEAGHYPQPQRPDLTSEAVLRSPMGRRPRPRGGNLAECTADRWTEARR